MSYFDGIKVGDKIWTIQEGWTKVIQVCCETFSTVKECYYADGNFNKNDAHQSAFWSDPGIIAPPRPKRLVKKTIEVGPYIHDDGKIYLAAQPHTRAHLLSFCGPVQTVEVEVEE